MQTSSQPARGLRVRCGVGGAIALAALAVVAVSSSGDDAPAADCALAPAAALVPPDRTVRSATMVNDATYLHMEVPGLDAWAQRTATTPEGERAAAFVARCADALADPATVAVTVPPDARAAVTAARRYAQEMWGERSLTRLLPVVIRRSVVADAPGWSLVLAGPDAVSWRYVVVDDEHRVVAWQLTGSDTDRLFADATSS